MGYMELLKLDVDNQRLNDYHSRVTIERGSKNHMRRPAFILGLITSLVLLAPMVFCQCAYSHGDNEFPGQGSRQDWDKAIPFYNQAVDLQNNDKYTAAIQKYKSAIAIYTFDENYWIGLGFCLEKVGNAKEGEVACRKAIDLDPKDWGPWENLANCLDDQGRESEARDAVLMALKKSPPENKRKEFEMAVKELDKRLAHANSSQ